MQQKYKEYLAIERKYQEWSAKRDNARAELVGTMVKEGIEKDETDYGTFTVASKTSYTYTDAVKKLTEAVRLKQIEEVEKGVAESRTTTFLRFQPKA